VFSRVLIANRGEIACRIIATCRRLGIRSIAVFSEADVEAPHVKAADEAICLGPAPVAESYLNPSALLRALHQSRADAVHPGYGFLSESADFSAAVEQSGRAFVGPSSRALEFLSDKIRARERAAQLGLPPVPAPAAPSAMRARKDGSNSQSGWGGHCS
jgi:acetyl/propionyl-CoA carboxylase alpha subunit